MAESVTGGAVELDIDLESLFGEELRCESKHRMQYNTPDGPEIVPDQVPCSITATHRFVAQHGQHMLICDNKTKLTLKHIEEMALWGGRCQCGRPIAECWNVLPL